MKVRTKPPIPVAKITAEQGLVKAEVKYRKHQEFEIMPYARNTSFVELATTVMQDKEGPWVNPLYIFESRHVTTIGVKELGRRTKDFLEEHSKKQPLDILSVAAGLSGDKLSVVALIRAYGEKPVFTDLYEYLGETTFDIEEEHENKLVVPANAYHKLTEEELTEHEKVVEKQDEIFENSTEEAPFLNSITQYVPRRLTEIDERQDLIYDLRTKDQQIQLNMPYNDFIQVFNSCMKYITSTEKDTYYNVLRGQTDKKVFMDVVEAYIHRTFIETARLPQEDIAALMGRLDRALFALYIVQDLIDDPMITDIKITDPKDIRVRVRGKAYNSNITFIDLADYLRFIQGLIVLNRVDPRLPSQTFTDDFDENYILRFSLTSAYVSGTGIPIIHIRKHMRVKKMSDTLIEEGMMNEVIRDYLLDCGKYSRGIVFAGPPGSGKTTLMNWFLEDAYESSAEILVIQENDELFTSRKGVMFEHVVTNPQGGELPCTLEDLGKMALVAGANVFIIGEAKGAEICSAITLSNSGCRTAITIHSQSSTDTIDKMTDLALRGSANTTYEQAKRMLKSFQTIVYLEDYKVREISEIVDYDDKKKDFIYRPIYRYKDSKKRR